MSYPVYYVPDGDTLPIMFTTYDGGTGASITMTGLAVTDIEIYKDGNITQRASDAGYSLIDTDGIDIDSTTGLHGFTLDLSDNTDAGFYAVGSWFHVVVNAVTVDAQTVTFIAAAFRIMAAEASAGVIDANIASSDNIGLTAQQKLDVNAEADTALTDYDAVIPADLNDPTAAVIADAVWDELQSAHVTAGSFGETATEIASILADTNELQTDNVPGLIAALNDLSAAEVNTEVDTALADINLDHLVGTATGIPALPAGTYFDQMLDDGTATFDRTTDSLQALRDRGDSAWTTGAGGSPPTTLQNTTIAAYTSQTSFTLTAGSADDDAYNGMLCIVTDQATSTQKAVGIVSDYTGSTKTVTLREDPLAGFTFANGDTIDIIAQSQDILQILDDTDLIDDGTSGLAKIATDVAAVLVDTAEIGAAGAGLTEAGGTGDQLTAVPWNAAWDAQVESEVNDGLVAYDAATGTDVSSLNDPTAAGIADAVWDEAQADHVAAGSFGVTASEIATILTNADAPISTVDTVVDGIQTDLSNATDGLGALKALIDTVDTVVDAIKVVTDALPDGGALTSNLPADVKAISGDTTAADRLEALMDGTLVGQANAGTPTSTTMPVDGIPVGNDDTYIGRLLTVLTGARAGEQTDITDYDATGNAGGEQFLTFTALTGALANDDFFVIH